jgi:phosphoglycerate kinase
MMPLRTLRDLDVTNKTVLLRVDLNVPIKHGKVEDMTRITRLVPTFEALLKQNAKIVVLSHFGRPKGEYNREFSLAPITNALSEALDGKAIKFALDCIGELAQNAVKELQPGDILLLENLRFHKGEEANDPSFTKQLASLGDCYINDTFSCSHRSHASIVGLAELLPSAAGLLLQEEIENVERVLENPERPLAAIVGGGKVSTKLEVLQNLSKKVDILAIGGAMANTFLKAAGYNIGKSLHEEDLVETAKTILAQAKSTSCEIILPKDVIVTKKFAERAPCEVLPITAVPEDGMILDIGPDSVQELSDRLNTVKSLVWNGPLGAFELSPFDVGTSSIARKVSSLTKQGKITSVAGGGDVVSALTQAGLVDSFTYISTAGGAFLEWLEGKELPGIAALKKTEALPRKQSLA